MLCRRAAFLQRLVAGVRLQSLQLVLLFRRAMWQSLRDRATHVSRAIASLSSAVIFGCIFWQLGHSQASVQSRMGLLQVRMPLLCMSTYPLSSCLGLCAPSCMVGSPSCQAMCLRCAIYACLGRAQRPESLKPRRWCKLP